MGVCVPCWYPCPLAMRHHPAPTPTKTMPTKNTGPVGKNNRLPPVAAIIGTVACFTDHRALFTDAVMSVKTPHPYCRLVLVAPKTSFFTDAATL